MPCLYNGVLLGNWEQWTAATWNDTAAAQKTVWSKSHIQKHAYCRASLIQTGKNNSKYTVVLEIREWLLQERKRRGNGLETGLMCFTVGVGMFFIVCLMLSIGTGACQLSAQTIWPLMNCFISCCVSPVLRRKTVQILQKYSRKKEVPVVLCTHIVGFAHYWPNTEPRFLVARGKGHLQWHLPGTCYHRTKEAATPGPKYRNSLK